MSKAQYRAPKMYGMEAPVKPSVTVGGAPQPRTGVPRPTTAPAAAAAGGDGELQKEYIYNLQQQVYFLELQLKYLRDAPGGGGGTPGRPRSELVADAGPIDHSIDELRGSYLKIEDEYKAKLAAEELRQQQLREEALASATHERRTQEEKAKALAQLQLVRDTCSSEKQELQGEVTALQRELERCYLAEKTVRRAQFSARAILTADRAISRHRAIPTAAPCFPLLQVRAELEQVTKQLEALKAFSEGADTEVRLLNSKIVEKEQSLATEAQRLDECRKELMDAQAQLHTLKTKDAASTSHAVHLEEARKAAAKEAEESGATLRLAQIELEQEKTGRKEADKTTDFLVRENAKLKTVLAELTGEHERLSTENARLKTEQERNKMTTVMSRFMIRKMREKQIAAQDAHKRIEGAQHGLHVALVKAQQKNDAIDTELAHQRRREAMREEHYRKQEEDASELTQENRLLLERVQLLGQTVDEHKAQLEKLHALQAQVQARNTVLQERADLAKALGAFKLEDLSALSKINTKMATSIDTLAQAIPKLEAATGV